jgi:histidine triad (HIT) family protein
MSDCIFCKIAAGELPARVVHRDERVLAVEDVNPQAPVHLLVMPVEHFDTLGQVVSGDQTQTLVPRLIEVASSLGRQHGADRGFRLVVNTGFDGGQTVGHMHIHVLAGRPMTWPPG